MSGFKPGSTLSLAPCAVNKELHKPGRAVQIYDAAALVLDPGQLKALTQRKRCDAQRRELDAMRVPYRVRTDGSLVVLRRDVEHNADVTLARREPELCP